MGRRRNKWGGFVVGVVAIQLGASMTYGYSFDGHAILGIVIMSVAILVTCMNYPTHLH